MKKAVVLILSVSMLCSCTSIDVAYFDNEERSPTSNIDIYTDFSRIEKEYKEIALLTADDNDWGQSETGMIEKLKGAAMRIGADAIVLQAGEKQSGGIGFVPGGFMYLDGNRVVRVIAIKYVD